jgi:hypothetical protein
VGWGWGMGRRRVRRARCLEGVSDGRNGKGAGTDSLVAGLLEAWRRR